MEFNQLEYLLTIVDNDFNLTTSAKILYISQPALSKFISELERKENVKIFNRKKGRIVGLTRIGANFIRNVRKVYHAYNQMITELENSASNEKGTVKIGIAPVIISTVFSDALVTFIQNNPGINLQIIEKGAYELQKLLLLGKIDIAILVSPTTFNTISERTIYQNSVAVWFNKNHRFSKIVGDIPLDEIGKEKIVTLDDSFMVTFQLKQMFARKNIQPNFFLKTQSWDLILNMCKHTNLVGIIAAPIANNYSTNNIEHRDIAPFFPWKISLCTMKNAQYNYVENYTIEWFNNYFKRKKVLTQH